MDIRTLPITLVALPKSGKELTVYPFFSQLQSCSMQTPLNFLICQNPSPFLWISNKLVSIANSDIPANFDEH